MSCRGTGTDGLSGLFNQCETNFCVSETPFLTNTSNTVENFASNIVGSDSQGRRQRHPLGGDDIKPGRDAQADAGRL